MILALLLFGLTATVVDLFLLAHYEDFKQVIPLVTSTLAVGVIGWHVLSGSATSLRIFQAVMAGLVVTGAVGVVLHFRGNMEFQLDIDPAIGALALFNKVMHAKAPPAMAPGAYVQLGLLGLVYTYRHPVLAHRRPVSTGEQS